MQIFIDLYQDFHSVVISQVLGLYMLIMSIIMIARAKYFREVILKVQPDDMLIVMSGTFTLFLGILLVTVHNHWVWDPTVLITIVSWLIFFKAICLLAFPKCTLSWSQRLYAGPGYYITLGIVFILGAILLAMGAYPFSAGAYWQSPI